jgi:N-acetylmuramoyl-L-alanine amidase
MDWRKIVIHHTASPSEVYLSGKMVPVDVNMIRVWHKTKGWNDIGYNFVIMPDGSCQDGRPLNSAGAHCRAGNRNTIGVGVCLVGNFSEIDVPEIQLNGLVSKVLKLMKDYNLNIKDVELHREVPGAATECPGRQFPLDIFRKKLLEG